MDSKNILEEYMNQSNDNALEEVQADSICGDLFDCCCANCYCFTNCASGDCC